MSDLTREREPELTDRDSNRPRLLHTFITPRGRDPQPGDVALCGRVKRTPYLGVKDLERCVVCADLYPRAAP